MKNNELIKVVGAIIILGLVGNPITGHAVSVKAKATPKKQQNFKPAPAGKKGKSKVVIQFADKFPNKDASKFGKVEFGAKKDTSGKKKKPAAKFKFGEPFQAQNGSAVSVELVSLSLTSLNPVSLDPFLDPKDRGQGLVGNLNLGLAAPAINRKSKAKLDPSGKKKGKLDMKLNKSLKVSAKKPGKKKKQKTKKPLKFSALGVDFSFASPITITDPEFCLDNVDLEGKATGNGSICLAPIPNPVPIPGALGLFGIGLASLAGLQLFRRRKPALSHA